MPASMTSEHGDDDVRGDQGEGEDEEALVFENGIDEKRVISHDLYIHSIIAGSKIDSNG